MFFFSWKHSEIRLYTFKPVDGNSGFIPESSLTLYPFSSQLEKPKMMLNLNRVYLFCQMWTLGTALNKQWNEDIRSKGIKYFPHDSALFRIKHAGVQLNKQIIEQK